MSDNLLEKKMTLGKYITQKRKSKNLSQRQLAKEIGISHSTISRIEKDYGLCPDNATLRALAERLEVDYNYLLVLNGSIDDEPEIRIIQRIVKKMNASEKQKMLNILKASFEEFFNEDM